MLPIVGWKVWHDDGTVYSSATHTWDEVPSPGVQVLCRYHEQPYRTYTHGTDDYTLTGVETPKLGRWMSDEEYAALVEIALADGEWP